MKHLGKILSPLALTFIVAAPLSAADTVTNAPQKNPMAKAMLKKLEKAELTDEQVAKIMKATEKVAALYQKGIYTPEQKKAYAEAIKKAKAEGKTGKELAAAVKEAIKLTPQQVAARKEWQRAYSAMKKEVLGMLTDEQKAKLPRKSSRSKKTG